MPLPLLLATTAAAHNHLRCRCCYMLAACYNDDVMNETSLTTFKFYILNADKDHHSCSQGPKLSLIDSFNRQLLFSNIQLVMLLSKANLACYSGSGMKERTFRIERNSKEPNN